MNLYKTVISTERYGSNGFHSEGMTVPVAADRAVEKADVYIRKAYGTADDRKLKHVVTSCVLVEEDWA